MDRIVTHPLYLPAILLLAFLGEGIVEAMAQALGY